MTNTRPLRETFGAYWDVVALLDYSDEPNNVLLVSDRTLYILNNLSLVDIRNLGRYYLEKFPSGYASFVDESDSEAEDIADVANNVGLELFPVSDIRPVYSLTGSLTTSTSGIANDTITDLPVTTFDALPAEIITYSSGVFTVVRSGRYTLSMAVYWAAHATGYRQCRIELNGTLVGLAFQIPGVAQVFTQGLTISPYLFAGDTFRFRVRQTSTTTLNVNGNTAPSYLTSLSVIGF